MNDRVLIDTSALLALAHPRDQFHSRAVTTARRFLSKSGRWVGTMLVLGELHGHLLHRRGPAQAHDLTDALLDDSAYEWVDTTVDLVRTAVASWIERFRDQAFSLTDAVSFEVMRREGLRAAFAYDDHFRTAGFELLR